MADFEHNDKQLSMQAKVHAELDGVRLDQAAAALFPDYSRSRLQSWVRDGSLRLGGKLAKSKDKVYLGDQLSVLAELETERAWLAEDIPLDVVYQDKQIIVVNKPAGLVTHPGAGNPGGTLANAVLHHVPEVGVIPRAGIVHRLDKDTSGLLVVALTLPAHNSLVTQLQARSVSRQYVALVHGRPPPTGSVEMALGRHAHHRQKMAVKVNGGKRAVTHFRTLEYFTDLALVELKLETGRTHQIRVHMAELGHPLIGDPLYGRKRPPPKTLTAEVRQAVMEFPRQALHAERLALQHPTDPQEMAWQANPPEDFQQLLAILREK